MSDGRQRIATDNAPPESGGYSQGVRAAGLLFLSGQAPFAPSGDLVAGSISAQVRQALSNLDAVARAGGSSLARAVRVGVYLSDLKDFEEMDAAYRAFFVDSDVLPARTTIQSSLIGFDVEIDAVVLAE
jgi:2-iminobutanoate/2-iminopropanoate deaminase